MSEPAVRLYLFSGARNSSWKLLQRFGALRMALRSGRDLHFVRAMGCGRGIAFSMMPDWHRYAVLAAGTDAQLDAFEGGDPMQQLGAQARQLEIYDLLPLRGHGAWDGEQPFTPGEPPAPQVPLAVITRARIPLRGILKFIRHSEKVTATLEAAKGRLFSIGMGELPFIQQATFSVWSDAESMLAFAYGSDMHRTAVAATRRDKIFSEELFWRFAVRGYTMRPLS